MMSQSEVNALLRDDCEPIRGRYDIALPSWISPEISPATIVAIIQGGCASGAYMPAVTVKGTRRRFGESIWSPSSKSHAISVMNEHGDDILEYIDDVLGYVPAESPHPPKIARLTGHAWTRLSWGDMAVHYLSTAVELWARSAATRTWLYKL